MIELIELFSAILGGIFGAFIAVNVVSIILAVAVHVLILWLIVMVALRIWDRREQKKMAALLPVHDRENGNEIGEEEPWMKARRIAAEQIAEAKKKSQQRKKKFLVAVISIAVMGIIVGNVVSILLKRARYVDISSAEVGSRVLFGHYKGSKGWIVLDKQDDKLLILSENAICDKAFNEERVSVTWSTRSLRHWLNTDYLKQAFSEGELESIADTSVYTEPSPGWKSTPGENTIDKVFLLSIEEAEMYFSNNKGRMITTAKGGKCWWWLRTPCDDYTAAYVYYNGEINGAGSDVDNAEFSVRPAMWIDLKAD